MPETQHKNVGARRDVRQRGVYERVSMVGHSQRSIGEGDGWITSVAGESSINSKDVRLHVRHHTGDGISHERGRTRCCKKQTKQANACDENGFWGISLCMKSS